MAHVVVAHVVMAHVVMAHVAMAYVVMAQAVMAMSFGHVCLYHTFSREPSLEPQLDQKKNIRFWFSAL